MPGHIYLRTGDFESAAATNEIAMRVDEEYLALSHAMGVYGMMYVAHNVHFVAVSRAEQGRFEDSWAAAQRLTRAPLARDIGAEIPVRASAGPLQRSCGRRDAVRAWSASPAAAQERIERTLLALS